MNSLENTWPLTAVIFLEPHDHCFRYTLVLSLVAFAARRRAAATLSLPLVERRRTATGSWRRSPAAAGRARLRGSWRPARCRLTFVPPPCWASAMAVSYSHQEILQGHSVSVSIAPHGPHVHTHVTIIYIYIYILLE